MDCRLKEPDSRAWQVVLASAFFILLGLSALSAVLDDAPYDTVMWDPLDPFGFAALSNASALASAALPASGTAAGLGAGWSANAYPGTGEGHLGIFDPVTSNAILLGPHGFGQRRAADAEYPDGVDRYVPWADLATTQALAAALAPLATAQQVAEAVSGAVTNLNLYAVPAAGGKHELWVKE